MTTHLPGRLNNDCATVEPGDFELYCIVVDAPSRMAIRVAQAKAALDL